MEAAVQAFGPVDTPLSARITSNEPALKASTSMHALGRIGHPEVEKLRPESPD